MIQAGSSRDVASHSRFHTHAVVFSDRSLQLIEWHVDHHDDALLPERRRSAALQHLEQIGDQTRCG